MRGDQNRWRKGRWAMESARGGDGDNGGGGWRSTLMEAATLTLNRERRKTLYLERLLFFVFRKISKA